MQTPRPPNETTPQRIKRVCRSLVTPRYYSRPYLVALAILLLAGGILVLGLIVGKPATNLFRSYTDTMRHNASPP